MGVPGFSTWFSTKAAPEAFVPLHVGRHSFDHVYVDLASVLHGVLRNARNPSQINKLLFQRLDMLLRRYNPRHTFMLAMDGPAPLAKLLTQRARRLSAGRREFNGKTRGVSSLGLTPGTPFMASLEDSLRFYISQRLKSWSHVQFELSGTTVPGEGEVKIFDRLLHPLPGSSPRHTHAVVGGDSDLYLMALSLRPSMDNLWIVPEVDFGSARKTTQGFSLEALEKSWGKKEQVTGSGSSEVAARRLASLKSDMAALAMMAHGNDYLPGIPFLNLDRTSGPSVWTTYLSLRKSADWKDRSLVVVEGGRSRMDPQVLTALLEAAARGHTRGSEGVNVLKPEPDPAKYIQGLEWVLDMYRTGACSDYRFVYDNQSPGQAQLLEHLGQGQGADEAMEPMPTEQVLTSALKPAVCAMALLPKLAGQLHAPIPLRELMNEGSPIADIYYQCPECQKFLQAGAEKRHNLLKAVNQLSRALGKEEETKKSMEKQAASSSTATESSPSEAQAAESSQAAKHVAECTSALQSAKDACRNLEKRRFQHMVDMHPYQRFPIERIERAVESVPIESFSEDDRVHMEFGSSFAYWRRAQGEECCCPSCQSARAMGNSTSLDGAQTCQYAYPLPDSPFPYSKAEPLTRADGLRRAPVPSSIPERGEGSDAAVSAGNACQCPKCRQNIFRGFTQAPYVGAPIQRTLHANQKRKRKPKRSGTKQGSSAPPKPQKAAQKAQKATQPQVQRAKMMSSPKFSGLLLNTQHQVSSMHQLQGQGMRALHTSAGCSSKARSPAWEYPAVCWQPAALGSLSAIRPSWQGSPPSKIFQAIGSRTCWARHISGLSVPPPPRTGAHRQMLQPRSCSQVLQVVRHICRR